MGRTGPIGAVGRAGRRPRWRRANPELLMNHSGAGPPRVRDRLFPLPPQPAPAAAVRARCVYPPLPIHSGIVILKGFYQQYSFESFYLLKVGKKKKKPLGHTLFFFFFFSLKSGLSCIRRFALFYLRINSWLLCSTAGSGCEACTLVSVEDVTGSL